MNSLNILSGRVSPPQSAAPSRSNSYGNILSSAAITESRRGSRDSILNEKEDISTDVAGAENDIVNDASEDTPLLEKIVDTQQSANSGGWNSIPRISTGILESIRLVLSTLAAPGVYLIACLYDERGNFAPFSQILKLGSVFSGNSRKASTTQALGVSSADARSSQGDHSNGNGVSGRRGLGKMAKFSSSSSSSGLSSESESELDRSMSETDQPISGSANRQTRSKSLQSPDEIAPARRSIRIKLHNEDSLRHRKHRKSSSTNTQSNGSGAIQAGEITPATLKSPTSPAASLLMTKYPRAPAPPRPLIPRRQPSYTIPDAPSGGLTQKTLILDLDETLIHSMAKGGRMSTGHMVEVKLNTLVGAGGASIGTQHPILYYVHKRPHCDDFLRRVSDYVLYGNMC
jgi:CTD nuclear envelope phosphatase 1